MLEFETLIKAVGFSALSGPYRNQRDFSDKIKDTLEDKYGYLYTNDYQIQSSDNLSGLESQCIDFVVWKGQGNGEHNNIKEASGIETLYHASNKEDCYGERVSFESFDLDLFDEKYNKLNALLEKEKSNKFLNCFLICSSNDRKQIDRLVNHCKDIKILDKDEYAKITDRLDVMQKGSYLNSTNYILTIEMVRDFKNKYQIHNRVLIHIDSR